MKTAQTTLILLAFMFLQAPYAKALDHATPVLIELFTAQGCPSCPPADALVKKLNEENPANIVLACHVDYYDDLGWKDPMVQSFCMDRHSAYQESVPLPQITAPTIILNGKYGMTGAREELVRDGIAMARSVDAMVMITLQKREGFLDITLPSTSLAQSTNVIFVGFENPQTVNITDGENIGQSIEYMNVVKYMSKLFTWDGSYKTISIPLKAYPTSGYAILLQDEKTSAVRGIASID